MVKAYSAPAATIKRGLLRMKSVIVAFPRVEVTKAGEGPLWVLCHEAYTLSELKADNQFVHGRQSRQVVSVP
jgi:hypothetical protein